MTAGRYRLVRRWLRRWVGNPIASVVLVAVLVVDAFTLPREWNPTWAGRAVGRVFPSGARINPGGPYTLYISDEPGGMRILDPEVESWDELADMLIDDRERVVRWELFRGTARRGVWSHVVETEYEVFLATPMVGRWSEEDLRAARVALFSEQAESMPCWRWLASCRSVRESDQWSARVLWGGVAHDAFAVGVVSLLLYSFTRWPAWFAAHPLSRRSRRLARGLCPACGYDLRGIDAGLCPECGRAEPRA